ncbi:MAG TPA: VOC family protein [Kofleriaceae bacterium]|nr:VOC family protein [Kofleriaceae bacterium]
MLAACTAPHTAVVASSTAPPVADRLTADAKPYWAAISVPDVDASARWYQDKLHFTVTRRMDLPEHQLRIVFLDLAGFTLELLELRDSVSLATVQARIPEVTAREKLQGFQKLGFLVGDVDRLAAELKRSGVTLRMEPTDEKPPGLRFFLVEDNAGNVLQFFQAPRK